MIDKGKGTFTILHSSPGANVREYRIYGMTVKSDIPLVAVPAPPGTVPDIVLCRAEADHPPAPDGPQLASIRCHMHGIEMIEHRGPKGTWIWLASIGTFHIDRDGRHVDCYLDRQVDDRVLGLAVAGPVLLFALHQLGYPSLHASAIIGPRGAVGFLGPRGRGKSAMASCFLRSGAPLLTDDALALVRQDDGIYGAPGLPYMKVWNETARHVLELSDELPNLAPQLEKKLLTLEDRYAVADAPVPIHTLYVLDRYHPGAMKRTTISIRPLHGPEAICVLLAYTSIRDYLVPADEAIVLPLYAQLISQARVRVLTYPDGFEHQVAVHGRILDDLNHE